jgi:glycosyltransferase involved in cell wall biosynthesis
LLESLFQPVLSYVKTERALSSLHCWEDAQIVWTLIERAACITRRLSPGATIIFSPGEVYPAFRTFLSTEGRGAGRLALVRRFVAWWWSSRMQRCAVGAADGVIAISSHVKDQLSNRYKELKRVIVSFNPAPDLPQVSDVDRERIRSEVRDSLGIPRSAYTFISAGRLTQRKGFDFLLEAFAALPSKAVHLVICGEGELLEKLQAQSATLGIEARVHFAGYVSPIWRYFVSADCFVSTAVYEPFGNVFVEAMACGLPVVGLAGPDDGVETATEEIIQGEEYGSVVRGKDLDALVERMRQMSEQSSEKRARMANAAREAVRSRFSRQVVLSQQFQFAVGLLNGSAMRQTTAPQPGKIEGERDGKM